MRILVPAVVAVLALCGSASADERIIPIVNGKTGVGQGIICDTSDQANRFLALRNNGSSIDGAVQLVNSEASDERACGAAVVAFKLEEELQQANLQHMDGKPVSVVKITVVAFSQDGENWSPILPKVQYTVLPANGQDV